MSSSVYKNMSRRWSHDHFGWCCWVLLEGRKLSYYVFLWKPQVCRWDIVHSILKETVGTTFKVLSLHSSETIFIQIQNMVCGPGSSVGIATAYWLDGPGIECRWGEIFRTCPDRPWGPHSLLYNGYRVFPWGKVRPGRDADPSPLLAPRSKIEYSYTSTLPKGLCGL